MIRLTIARRLTRRVVAKTTIALSVALGLCALALAVYPLATDHYQAGVQRRLVTRLQSSDLRRAYTERRIAPGDSLTRILIPSVDLDVVVVEGTSASALRAGAGHYQGTPLPGEAGNVGIAGHRTTYGKPFSAIDRLHTSAEVILVTPTGRYTYRLSRPPFIVANNDWSVIAPRPGSVLTLTTCHPKGSARQRLVVRAELSPSPSQGT
jgi:sortase A